MAAAARNQFEPGATIAGRYRLGRVLGRGGMGTVYEAEHLQLGRRVAVKVLLPEYATDADVVKRFLREARAAASIEHRGIVEIFDLGHDGPIAFLAMQLLQGEELAQLLRRAHPLPVAQVVSIVADLADAIAAAHARGIVHRDLKPQNVFLVGDGAAPVVKVLDFGVAKLMTHEDGLTALTRTGEVFGTPLYMSPEQLHGVRDVDARTDVYAMAVILYECLAGAPPFQATSYSQLVLKICTETPLPIREVRPEVPDAVAALIELGMARDPENRLGSAAALRDALRDVLARDLCAASDTLPALMNAALAETMPSVPGNARVLVPAVASVDSTGAGAGRARRVPLVIGAVSAVLISVAGIAIVMASDGDEVVAASMLTDAGGREAAAQLAIADAVVAAPDHEAAVGAATHDAAVGDVAAAVATRAIAFDVSPAGVGISVNGALLCSSPCSVAVPDVPSVMRFERDGFVAEERAFAAPLPERVSLSLVRARRGAVRETRAVASDAGAPVVPRLRER